MHVYAAGGRALVVEFGMSTQFSNLLCLCCMRFIMIKKQRAKDTWKQVYGHLHNHGLSDVLAAHEYHYFLEKEARVAPLSDVGGDHLTRGLVLTDTQWEYILNLHRQFGDTSSHELNPIHLDDPPCARCFRFPKPRKSPKLLRTNCDCLFTRPTDGSVFQGALNVLQILAKRAPRSEGAQREKRPAKRSGQ